MKHGSFWVKLELSLKGAQAAEVPRANSTYEDIC